MDGRPFPDFVRSLLDEAVGIHEELTNLRRIILDRSDQQGRPEVPERQQDQQINAATFEILLLLRQIVSPEHLRAAHSDMRRSAMSPVSLS